MGNHRPWKIRQTNDKLMTEESVVIDAGSLYCKAGFGGDDCPRAVFHTVVGRPKATALAANADLKPYFVGDDADLKRDLLKLSGPVDHGTVTDWEDMEKVWQYAFDSLRIPPQEYAVLVAEAPFNGPKAQIEKTAQIMFETFQVPRFYTMWQAVLALYASGRTTGLALDMGDEVTRFVPVYEGYALSHAMLRLDLGGDDITKYLMRLLNEHGHSFNPSTDLEIVRSIKEQLCYVALDFDQEMSGANGQGKVEKVYELPDGNVITVGNERFRCSEAFFDPFHHLGFETPRVHMTVHQSITRCDPDIRNDLYQNIVLSGGSTLFPGLCDRLHKEMTALVPGVKVNIVAPPERKYSAWLGGSILTTLPTFRELSVSKSEYDEHGVNVIHKKCYN